MITGENDSKLFATYIDYSSAFDSVSHKYLDRILTNAGASRKTPPRFCTIYAAAEGIARVKGLHDNKVHIASFKVRRGVIQCNIIQGDIISPIFFTLAMEQLFPTHKNFSAGIKVVDNYLQIHSRPWVCG